MTKTLVINKLCLALIGLGVVTVSSLFYFYGRPLWLPALQSIIGKRTVAEIVQRYGTGVRRELRAQSERAGMAYPPARVTMLAIKDERRLEIWVGTKEVFKFLKSYPILAASGVAGPKLNEGDRQVPEGIYRISGLNPNSSYHLSLKLNYPNAFDLTNAVNDGRRSPGSNIFIHGRESSIGCLAMGDPAVEELFVLVADVGKENIQVLLAPRDPRRSRLNADGHPPWVGVLYQELAREFSRYVNNATN